MTHAMAARLSKNELGDLAVKSALELERSRAGVAFDKSSLADLAEALRVSAGEQDLAGDSLVRYMRPGYFEPFEHVYMSAHAGDEPESAEQIRLYVTAFIQEIEQALVSERIDEGLTYKLVDFCLELNRQLVRRQPAEVRRGRRQRGVDAEALLR